VPRHAATTEIEAGQVDGPDSVPNIWSDRTIGALLFVGSVLVYVAVSRGQQYAYDGNAMLAVSMNIVNHASLKTTGFVDVFHQSTPFSPYGIAMSLLGVVPYALSKVTGHAAVLIAMVVPMLTALAVVVMYRIARALGWSAMYGVLVAVAFGMLSMALAYTTEYFSEPGVMLCVSVMVLGIIRWGQGKSYAPLLVGIGAGCALQFRSDSLLTVWAGLLALPLFVPWSRLVKLRGVLLMGIPLVVSVLLLVGYNVLRYSKPYVGEYGGNFSTSLGYGLRGLLFSPGKSIFLYEPVILLGVVGLVMMFWRNLPLAALFTLLIVPRLIFFAKWSAWQGGWSWGPRFMLPVVPLLTLCAVDVLRATKPGTVMGWLTRGVFVLLALGALFVGYLSVRVPYEQWLQVQTSPAARSVFHINGSTAAITSEFNLSTNPIWGDVLLLRHNMAKMAPVLWREGHWYIGWPVLIVGIALLGLAAYGASGVRGSHVAQGRPVARSSDETESEWLDEASTSSAGAVAGTFLGSSTGARTVADATSGNM
jgi:hypothetical protein